LESSELGFKLQCEVYNKDSFVSDFCSGLPLHAYNTCIFSNKKFRNMFTPTFEKDIRSWGTFLFLPKVQKIEPSADLVLGVPVLSLSKARGQQRLACFFLLENKCR
jgi:hypothetical protein